MRDTRDVRTAWCDHLLARLVAAIAREAPAGLGLWEGLGAVIDAPSGELLLELRRIERGGGDQERAKRLGLDVLAAWRRAGEAWQAKAA